MYNNDCTDAYSSCMRWKNLFATRKSFAHWMKCKPGEESELIDNSDLAPLLVFTYELYKVHHSEPKLQLPDQKSSTMLAPRRSFPIRYTKLSSHIAHSSDPITLLWKIVIWSCAFAMGSSHWNENHSYISETAGLKGTRMATSIGCEHFCHQH